MNCPACDHVNADGARYCAKCGALLPVAHVDGNDPMVGSVVGGRYRITGLLGEGGMGRVYIGEQQMGTAVRKVAVKTLLQEFSKDPQVVARFMRECGTVVELEHPNTIKFFDFGQTDSGDLYIAMEFVDGRPLSAVIEKEGAMSWDRVDKIMKQVCGSLHEAHEKGVVHRDLKPENVILMERAHEADFVKVLDFGIAKRHDAADTKKEQKLTQAGMVLGTPPYMSPEQFTGRELDRRSDIYSLGVMSYEMLTGQLPFKANTPWEWATQHMTVQPHPFEQTGPMAAQIPPHIKQACMKALAKDANERQNTALEFYKDLSGDGATKAAAAAVARQGAAATEAFAAASSGAPASAPAAGARKGTGTQVGEPMVAPPGMDIGMLAQPPMHQHQHVPTAGGQAIPAPPPDYGQQRGGGGKGIWIALAVLVAGGMAFGAYWFVLRPQPETDTGPIVKTDDDKDDKKSGSKSGKSEDEDDGGETSGGDDGTTTPEPSATTSTAPEPPTPDPQPSAEPTDPQPPGPQPPGPQPPGPQPPNPQPPKDDGAKYCSQAQSLAAQKKCPQANSALGKCTGPGRTSAAAYVASNCSSRSPRPGLRR